MKTKTKKNRIQVMILLLPGILFFLIFTIYPIIKLFVMSFFEWDFGSMFNNKFIGFSNYKEVLTDSYFYTAFTNTLVYTLVTVPLQMILGLLVALLLNSISHLKVTFRVLYYIPVITTWVIASLVFRYIFNNEGLLNYFLTNITHFTSNNIRWLDSRWSGLFIAMALGIWKGIGWNMVIFLAALQGVPKDYYEAADLDGANTIRKFFNITLPCIKSTILFALVMLTIGGFNVYTSIKLITDGGPAHTTDTVLTWMYYKAFSTGKFGYSAAFSFIIAVVLGLLAAVQFKMMKNKDGGN